MAVVTAGLVGMSGCRCLVSAGASWVLSAHHHGELQETVLSVDSKHPWKGESNVKAIQK